MLKRSNFINGIWSRGTAGEVTVVNPATEEPLGAYQLRVARRLQAGQVDINDGAFNPVAPFGGYKQSGLGRELGRFGLEEYLEVESLQR